MRFNVPITPREFSVVFDAIPPGLSMLFRCSDSSPPLSFNPPHVSQSSIGNVCFSSGKLLNPRIRALFQNGLISTPPAKFYWDNFVSDIEWKKVWTLPHKFFLTNKVKEISFKLIHKFYPTKQHLSKMRNDIDVNCTFCQKHPETYSHLFWSCEFTYKFWRDLHKYVTDSIFTDFHLYYKNIIFGFHNINQKDNKAFFLINMLLLLAMFHIHKTKFTNRKPELFVFLKELQQYMRTIASSKNTKALKTISVCNSLNLYRPT